MSNKENRIKESSPFDLKWFLSSKREKKKDLNEKNCQMMVIKIYYKYTLKKS